MTLPSKLSFAGSLTSEQRTSFYERHKPVAVVMILLVFMLPFIGLFIWGLLGVVLAVLISVLVYYLTPYAVLKIETRRQ
jgi:fatty-acid desaturase